VSDATPLLLLVAAAPDAPGVPAILDRARADAAAGREVRVLLTGAALAAPSDPRWRALREAGAALSLCSRSARDRGLGPEAAPGVTWSSLVAFLRDRPPGSRLWGCFP
jgi:hypothetical protein